jgi:hypothetical protein
MSEKLRLAGALKQDDPLVRDNRLLPLTTTAMSPKLPRQW